MKKSAITLLAFLLVGLACVSSLWAAVTANIKNPASGSQFLAGETVFLNGSGIETPSNDALTTNQLKWYVNGIAIGVGELKTWQPTAGTYRVTLVGERGGRFGVDEIQVTVLSESDLTVTVNITSPSSNDEFLEGETIFLEGRARVTETGLPIMDGQVTWYANGVFIGSGKLLRWQPVAGLYRVTLIGEKGGRTDRDEIDVTVLSGGDETVTVNIVSPADGQEYGTGDLILFIGEGRVSETDQLLSGTQLMWYSDRDDLIGEGTSFSKKDLSPGEHLITLVGKGKAISTIILTIGSSSIYVPEPIKEGESAFYDWAKNILYIPLWVEGVPYFLNLAVTDWTTDPIEMTLRYIGPGTSSDRYKYASFDFLSNTLLVPDFKTGGKSYTLDLRLTTNEAPFVFDLVKSTLNP